MRMAYVCADRGVPVFGRKGCSIHVQEVLRALAGLGVQVDLFTPRPEREPPPGLEGIRVHPLPAVVTGKGGDAERAALAGNDDLRAALEREGPFDFLYERYSLWSRAGMAYARDHGVPGLLEVNAPLIEEQAEYRVLVDRAAAERVAEEVFRDATGLIAVSQEIKTYLEEHYPPSRGRVVVLANGVDPGRFPDDQRPSCPAPPGTFTVGFVGTLKPWHGLATLVEAFALFQERAADSRLLFVGDGPERERLVADLARRGLRQKVHFVGAVAASEVPGFLASMDVAAAPYPMLSHFYFSPLKVYEYLAAARPVVASRIGQLAELIQHERNGLLVPPGDPPALAAALERLWRQPDLRQRLGQAGRAMVLRSHTWEMVARRILDLAGIPSRFAAVHRTAVGRTAAKREVRELR
jgi:glycosyltransferase involved in cell wall biosynthesis